MDYREFINFSPCAFYVHDLEGRLLDVNEKSCQYLGYTRPELLQLTLPDFVVNFNINAFKTIWEHIKPKEIFHKQSEHRRKDGTTFPVEISLSLHESQHEKVILAIAVDITQRLLSEEAQLRITRLYYAYSNLNRFLIRAENEHTILEKLCTIAVECAWVKFAWVAVPNETLTELNPLFMAGETLNISWQTISLTDDPHSCHNPVVTAFQENRVINIPDLHQNSWCQPIQSNSLGACALFPISRKNKVHAIFAVYHENPHGFCALSIRLFEDMVQDISYSFEYLDQKREQETLNNNLRQSEAKFLSLFTNSPIPHWVSLDDSQQIITINDAWIQFTGYTQNDILQKKITSLDLMDAPHIWSQLNSEGQIRPIINQEIVLRKKNGTLAICLASFYLTEFDQKKCWIWMAQDITELRQTLMKVEENNNFLNAIFEQEPHCIKIFSNTGELLQINQAGLNIFSVANLSYLQQQGIAHFIDPRYHQEFVRCLDQCAQGHNVQITYLMHTESGIERWIEAHATPLKNIKNQISSIIMVSQDISEKKRSQETIWRQAHFDQLTHLPNRHYFNKLLIQEMATAARENLPLSLFFLDIDHFKEINDTLGHSIGDQVLSVIAERIRKTVRESDVIARFAGDEFVILIRHTRTPEALNKIAQQLLEQLSLPLELSHISTRIQISASIGISHFPKDAATSERLIQFADQAMYEAKNTGRNTFYHYQPMITLQHKVRQQRIHELNEGLQHHEFELYLQPILDCHTLLCHKAEVLVRWNHPNDGLVLPGNFIHLAEECGLILELGLWVFQESLRILQYLQRARPNFSLAINLSPKQLLGPEEQFKALVDAYVNSKISGRFIILEITESLLLEPNPQVLNRLRQLHDLGMSIAIDDFGTGFSALSYLHKFPIDIIKIDRCFITQIQHNPNNQKLSAAMINLSHTLGMTVVAEGVETEDELAWLTQMNCDFLQGYLFNKPLPVSTFVKLLIAPSPSALSLLREKPRRSGRDG